MLMLSWQNRQKLELILRILCGFVVHSTVKMKNCHGICFHCQLFWISGHIFSEKTKISREFLFITSFSDRNWLSEQYVSHFAIILHDRSPFSHGTETENVYSLWNYWFWNSTTRNDCTATGRCHFIRVKQKNSGLAIWPQFYEFNQTLVWGKNV